jgi:phosphate transport system protein
MPKKIIKLHISRRFDQELEEIRNQVLAMGGMVEQQVDQAGKAFISFDLQGAEVVLQQERLVDAFEKNIDRECSEILARRQPAAVDLRLLFATLKIITDLERFGDEAVRIARMILHIPGPDYYQGECHEIEQLLALVKEMLRGALDAYARTEVQEVLAITAQDDRVDSEYRVITRQLIIQMIENPRYVVRMLDMLWAVRALERIGDHACSVCEHVVYMVKAKDVRHLSRLELEKTIRAAR